MLLLQWSKRRKTRRIGFILLCFCWVTFAVNAQDNAPVHLIDGEFIKEWLVLGPFHPNDLEIDFLADVGGEANINPKEGDTVTRPDGKTLTWKPYRAKGHVIDLIDAVGQVENAVAYAFCILQSDASGETEIRFGKEDGFAIFLNGQLVRSSPGPMFYSLALNLPVFDANFLSGPNRCLIKLVQKQGEWVFAMRIIPLEHAVVKSMVTDAQGQPLSNRILVFLEQNHREITRVRTDERGMYQIRVYPPRLAYDLTVTRGEQGAWKSNIPLSPGVQRTVNLTLEDANHLSGTLWMLDDRTPHTGVVVQAVRPPINAEEEPFVVNSTLSDENGEYEFVNLQPGRYQVRCYTASGYVYYQDVESRPDSTERDRQQKNTQRWAKTFGLESGTTFTNIDFRFPPFKKGVWTNYTHLDGLVHNNVSDITTGTDGALWFKTESGSICRYDGTQFVSLKTEDGSVDKDAGAIYHDADGMTWIGRFGKISYGNGKTFTDFTEKDGLTPHWITGIHDGNDGDMWFGTWMGGVFHYDGSHFQHVTPKDGLGHHVIWDIGRDTNGAMWFGTRNGGVSRYDGKEFVTFTEKDGLASNNVFAVESGGKGDMWFGTWNRGVSHYDGKRMVNFSRRDGLPINNVTAVFRDADGMMWFGTNGRGVSRYDGKGFITFTTKDGLANDAVWGIHQTPDGSLWFATHGGGISRYHPDGILNLTAKDGLPPYPIGAIHRDPDGTMWFGTLGGGVYRYDGVAFDNWTEKTSLEPIFGKYRKPCYD